MKYLYYRADGTITGQRITSQGIDVVAQDALNNDSVFPLTENFENVFKTHYILDGALTERVPLSIVLNKQKIIADGIDSAVITGLAENVKVVWPDKLVSYGNFEFSVDLVAEYKFTVGNAEHIIQEITIEAIAAT